MKRTVLLLLPLALALSACTGEGTLGTPLWRERPSGVNVILNGVAYGEGRFVAVGGPAFEGSILVSEDGISWSRLSYTPGANMNGVEYLEGRFFAVGFDNTIVVSEDGLTWRKVHGPVGLGYLVDIAYGNGRFVALGTGYAFVSEDGESWQEVSLPTGFAMDLAGIAFGGGRFVATGQLGNAYVSEDGLTWERVNVGTDKGLGNPVYTGTLFLTTDGERVFASPDGLSWQALTPNRPLVGRRLAFGNGEILNLGGLASDVPVSTDGNAWRAERLPREAWLRDAAYGEGRWVAVGNYGAIFTRP